MIITIDIYRISSFYHTSIFYQGLIENLQDEESNLTINRFLNRINLIKKIQYLLMIQSISIVYTIDLIKLISICNFWGFDDLPYLG